MPLFDDLLREFAPFRGLSQPPTEAVKLWGEGAYGIWVAEIWGPAVPYHPVVHHGDGHKNYGYRRVKGDPTAAREIHEVEGWPELSRFLEVINLLETPIESVGCEKTCWPIPAGQVPTVQLGSYVRHLRSVGLDSKAWPREQLGTKRHLLKSKSRLFLRLATFRWLELNSSAL
jgi:hypothetical protein